MVKFENSKAKKNPSKRRGKSFEGKFSERNSSPRRNTRRNSDDRRSSSRDSRGRDRIERTKVTCSECKSECEVPFKPTSNKPIYCDDCFAKKPSKSSKDFDIINEKLDKIMKALKI
ncbi:hypothetical protein HN865_03860 [Candidatus Woesearchaeota archaeon]|jgi:CxxC-x17-CxxC domain-containing protein|nr:hypothetical protein [Candidatus Woesearchaeota archaeon]MBT7237968.1 hypothetical protein [Candidatus Woesearchaeota archaeon]